MTDFGLSKGIIVSLFACRYLCLREAAEGEGGSSGGAKKMSYLLPHLHSGWAVDQAILAEEERLVVIRFGHDWDETCMQVPLFSFSFLHPF